MTRTMYDGVTPSRIPASATMVAGYVDGKFANIPALRARFPHATVVEIAVSHTTRAQVLDVETGDATPAGAVQWCTQTMAATPNTELTVYCNESTWPAVKAAFAAAGVTPPQYWVARYGSSTAIPAGAVALQHTNTAGYDVSAVADHWPGVDGKATAPSKTPPKAPAKGGTYTVKDGDSMSAIAAAHGVSLSALEAANPQVTNPGVIHPGDVLHLPGGAKAPAAKTVTVGSGDSLSTIAAKHGLTLAEIERLNPSISNPNLIYPGETVRIA
jgi:LysM repeat protein